VARPEELSGQIWPIHLKPLDDELLSCWMVRLARAYGVKPVWFWNRVWKRDAVAYRFVDRSAPVELLLLLSAGTGTCYERVVQTTLQPLANVRSILSPVPSLRYCPECLAADPVPYFRRQWQMGFLLVCPLHGVRLRAACHRCREPLTPELLGLDAASVGCCSHCRADLREHSIAADEPVRSQVLDWERRLWSLVSSD
jgi:hypothetical protein